MPHVLPLFDFLPEARLATQEMARFIAQSTPKRAAAAHPRRAAAARFYRRSIWQGTAVSKAEVLMYRPRGA